MSSCRYTSIGHLRASTVVKGSLLRYVGHTCPLEGTQGYGDFVLLQLRWGLYCDV